MANKINVKLILELRKVNMSRNEIAATRHMSKNSVSEVIHLSDDLGITYDDVTDIDADTVYRMFYPDKYATELLYTNLDYEYVHKELTRVGVNLKLLWKEYKDKCASAHTVPMGYTKFCSGYSEFTVENNTEAGLFNFMSLIIRNLKSAKVPDLNAIRMNSHHCMHYQRFLMRLPHGFLEEQ